VLEEGIGEDQAGRSKESNWGRMRKDQQKWGLKRGGGGREDREVVSL